MNKSTRLIHTVKGALFARILEILEEAENNDLINIELEKSVVLTEKQLEDLMCVAYMLATEK